MMYYAPLMPSTPRYKKNKKPTERDLVNTKRDLLNSKRDLMNTKRETKKGDLMKEIYYMQKESY